MGTLNSPFLADWMRRAELEQDKQAELDEGMVPPWIATRRRNEEPGWMIEMRQAKERVGCVEEYDSALCLIKAGTFKTRKELAAHYHRTTAWAGAMVALMVKFCDLDDVKKHLPGVSRGGFAGRRKSN